MENNYSDLKKPKFQAEEKIKDILLSFGVKLARIKEAQARQAVTKESLQKIMSDMGLLTQEKMAQSSALMYDLPYLEPTKIDMVNGKFLRSKGVDLNVYDGHVPLGFKNGKLIVGISDFNKKNEALTYWHKFSQYYG